MSYRELRLLEALLTRFCNEEIDTEGRWITLGYLQQRIREKKQERTPQSDKP